jgi:hypothetical protein
MLPAWTLGLGAVLSVLQAALLAVATWLLAVARPRCCCAD